MSDPRRRALLKPFELLSISAGFGVFVLLIFLLTTRNFVNGIIAAGIVFIISIVVLAMLVMSYKPNPRSERFLDRFDEPDADDAPGGEPPGSGESDAGGHADAGPS